MFGKTQTHFSFVIKICLCVLGSKEVSKKVRSQTDPAINVYAVKSGRGLY